jgi:2-C-methyl-D-erythritol 4-phosphate cytidylyltransferase
VVVAAGTGTRFGSSKQYEVVAGRRVLDWSLDAARQHCDRVVAVVRPDRAASPEPLADVTVARAATRSGSVRAGLAAVSPQAAVIVVHDAARPGAAPAIWERVLAAIEAGADAAVPAVPVPDTIRALSGGTVDREGFVLVQTPQAFVAAVLRAAHDGEPEGTDDASLVEAIGGTVSVVDGDPANLKITAPHDLAAMAQLLG